MATWSDLHWSMLNLVAENLTDVTDHLSFSAVCSSWRSVALEIRLTFPCPFPALMIRGEDDNGYCISLSDGKICNQKLLIPHDEWYFGTHGGWLVTVHKNLDISLYNPFSRERVPLPSITSIPKFGERYYAKNNRVYVQSAAVSSSNTNVSPKDLTVMIAQGAYRRLAFAKPGDSSWQIIDNDKYLRYDDVVFYKGMFFAVGPNGTVMCDIGLNPKTSLVIKAGYSSFRPYEYARSKCYLVESQTGDLMLVERWIVYNKDLLYKDLTGQGISNNVGDHNKNNNGHTISKIDRDDIDDPEEEIRGDTLISKTRTYKTKFFLVHQMDCVGQRWIPVEGIGDQVIFVGFNSAFSLPAESGKGNRIYFTDDYAEGLEVAMMDYGKLYATDMGVYNLNDRSISPFINNIGDATFYPPPMWAICLPW